MARDEFRCQLRWRGCTTTAVEVDHRRNFSRGGTDDLGNLQAVCSSCHKRKTASESAAARAKLRRDARHPDSLRKHPGYV
ncbi:HNH endonuclease [Nocardia fluminea]|uniref:HNH endonuclease n=1 Tax=Nocardia fluminea TaxID=134984 RepID=UPI00366099D9